MDRRETIGVAVYLVGVAVVTYYFFQVGEIFRGVVAPVLGGIGIGIYLVVSLVTQDSSNRDARTLTWISAILILGPIVWYLIYGCVFGCPGG